MGVVNIGIVELFAAILLDLLPLIIVAVLIFIIYKAINRKK